MDYNNFRQSIHNSSSDDWNIIYCYGSGTGPSYREDTAAFLESMIMEIRSGERQKEWPKRYHTQVAAYKPNLSISLAWGLRLEAEELEEAWVEKFPSKRTFLDCVDLFYNNALVERVPYVKIDGGRCLLPKPRFPTLEVKREDVDLIRVVASLTILNPEYDRYLAQAGFQIV
ncbi:MAG TPA: hypothetical protein VGB77_00555 [Abditibacteriaceae bacterium]|jgi:hypothetical protein